MQVKLLRLIQEKTARPVGDQREQPVDVRILSATHRDLGELVAAGRFREDLYYRINVIEMRVPALRERLATCRNSPPRSRSVLPRASTWRRPRFRTRRWQLLATHDYPGNVRELENVIERALTLCDGGTIRPDDIELRGPPTFEETVPPHRPGTLPQTLEDIERASIRQGPGGGPLQQDGRGPRARHQLPGAALSHQETRHRVTRRVRHFVTRRVGSGVARPRRSSDKRRKNTDKSVTYSASRGLA